MSDTTPNDELRELIEEWRRDSEYMLEHNDDYKSPLATEGAANSMLDMADELEAVINDE